MSFFYIQIKIPFFFERCHRISQRLYVNPTSFGSFCAINQKGVFFHFCLPLFSGIRILGKHELMFFGKTSSFFNFISFLKKTDFTSQQLASCVSWKGLGYKMNSVTKKRINFWAGVPHGKIVNLPNLVYSIGIGTSIFFISRNKQKMKQFTSFFSSFKAKKKGFFLL